MSRKSVAHLVRRQAASAAATTKELAVSRIVVLGGGLVGRVMALDLARERDLQVTVAERDETVLARLRAEGLATIPLDLADDAAVRRAIAAADVVVGAAPGHMGYRLLRLVIEAGKPYADIAFMPEDFLTSTASCFPAWT